MSKKIGKYDIVGLIARGGFSNVYLATEPSLDVQVAIKVFAAEKATVESKPAWRQRFLQESKILHSLSSAPHIVHFMEFGFTEDQKPYIVMPYYKRTLADLLGEDNRLSQTHCIQIAKQVLDGLQAIHKAGILHLDIKPSNLLIDDHDHIQIADFGISELLNYPIVSTIPKTGENTTEQTAKFGSRHFASPEQISGHEQLTAASDMYSLAAVLYRCFTGSNIQNRNTDVEDRVNQELFLNLLAKVLQKDAKKRPQSATEFAALVQAFERNKVLEQDSVNFNNGNLVDDNATQVLSGLHQHDDDDPNGLVQIKLDIIAILRKCGHIDNFDYARLAFLAKATLHEDFDTFDLNEYIHIVKRQLIHNEPAFARFVLWLDQVDEQIAQSVRDNQFNLPTDIRDNLLQLGLAVLPGKSDSVTDGVQRRFDKSALEKLIQDRLNVFLLENSQDSNQSDFAHTHKTKPRSFLPKNVFIRLSVVVFVLLVASLVPNIKEFGKESRPLNSDVVSKTFKEKETPTNKVSVLKTQSPNVPDLDPNRLFQVRLDIQPVDAKVVLQAENGEMVPPERVPYGHYTVRISKNGYLTEKQNLIIDATRANEQFVMISARLMLSDSRYFIGDTDLSVANGTPLEFILLPKLNDSTERIRMMSFEVTNELYERCIMDGECLTPPMVSDKARQIIFGQPDHPVVNVSWYDINEKFIPWLEQQTKSRLRLPSAQEWEYAASAGTKGVEYSWGEEFRFDLAHCRDCYSINWRADDYRFSTRPVMSFPANQWQLYDLHGNVQEWTEDCVAAASPSLQIRCDQAIVKGGSWFTNHVSISIQTKQTLRKNARSHTTGFRLVEVLEINEQIGLKDEK